MAIRFSVNKAMAVLLALVAQVAFAQDVWDGTVDTTWYTKNKSATEFTITTAEQLAGLASLVSGGAGNGTYNMNGKTIMLGANIMLNDTTDWKNWETSPPANEWIPIGLYSTYDYYSSSVLPFSGTFDGNSYVISGVYIHEASMEDTLRKCQGLFGFMEYGTIENLGIVAFYIANASLKESYVGSLVGWNIGGTISNSYSTGTVAGGDGRGNRVGGLVGYNTTGNMRVRDGIISNSYFTGTVSGYTDVGGLVGYDEGYYGFTTDYNINNSYSTGTVSGNDNVGGLVGRARHSRIEKSYFTGMVTGIEKRVGGLVGNMDDGSGITYSYSACAVSGKNSTGGLVGYNVGSITNSYSTCTVTGDYYVGGLVGANTTLGRMSYAYYAGIVTGNSNGGLIGVMEYEGSSIKDSYYDKQISGQSYGIAYILFSESRIEGSTTAEMKQQSNFVGWNFTAVWGIDDKINCGYPYLLGFEYSEDEECNKSRECEMVGKVWENNSCRMKTVAELAQECEAAGNTWTIGVCKATVTIRSTQIASSQIIARTTNNGIILENLPRNAKVEVYNLHGKCIYNSQFSTLNYQFIEVQTKGVYIIKVGTQTFRIAIGQK